MTRLSKEQLNELADKWLKGTLTSREKEVLDRWYNLDATEPISWAGSEDSEAQLGQKLLFNINKKKKSAPFKRRYYIPAAAVLLITLGIGGYFYRLKSTVQIKQTTARIIDINPAGNKAYLTLGNGKRIALTDINNGIVANQANIEITKTSDGQLVYKITENASSHSSSIEYNTIETPMGGRYQVTLPDGTHVWMNAASVIKYPASFASLKERKIELSGEAYFEVAKDKQHPFVVKTNEQEVRVLGTHFNINSYTDEAETKTTLLEGSVAISAPNHKNSKILTPGQQAVLKGNVIRVGEADIEQALGWKNGDFVFNGEDLNTVMRQVAKWYDVEVEYQGNVNFSGVVSTITRTKKLSQVLKALEINQGIHFKVEGRRILVMP